MTAPPVAAAHDPTKARPLITGPEAPLPPHPLHMQGWVERGFGRGSSDLGCPTANLPDTEIERHGEQLKTGVHYGWARLYPRPGDNGTPLSPEDQGVLPMVMSVGWNPFYKNTKRTAEVHILHPFPHSFYGKEMRVSVLGYIRPELDYAGMDALIKDINMDKQVALNSLDRPGYIALKDDPYFARPSNLGPIDLAVLERRVAPATEGEGEKL